MASARAARCGEGPLPPRGRASRGRASQVWRPNQISSLRAPLRAAPTGGGNEKFLLALKPSRYPARARRPFLTAPATAGRRVPRPRPLRLRSPARGSPRRPPALPPSDPFAAQRCEARTERWENRASGKVTREPPSRPGGEPSASGPPEPGPSRCPRAVPELPSPLSPRGPFLRVAVSGNKPRTGASRRSGLCCSSSPSAERGARLRPARPEVRPCSRWSPSAAAPGAPGPPVPSAPAPLHLPRCRAVPAVRAEERRGHLAPSSLNFSSLSSAPARPHRAADPAPSRPPDACTGAAVDPPEMPSGAQGAAAPRPCPSPVRRTAVPLPGRPPAPCTARLPARRRAAGGAGALCPPLAGGTRPRSANQFGRGGDAAEVAPPGGGGGRGRAR